MESPKHDAFRHVFRTKHYEADDLRGRLAQRMHYGLEQDILKHAYERAKGYGLSAATAATAFEYYLDRSKNGYSEGYHDVRSDVAGEFTPSASVLLDVRTAEQAGYGLPRAGMSRADAWRWDALSQLRQTLRHHLDVQIKNDATPRDADVIAVLTDKRDRLAAGGHTCYTRVDLQIALLEEVLNS